MTDSEYKLLRLKQFLGEKKMKQLGLIPCSTCIQIMEQATSFVMPKNLASKTYLTADDIAQINAVLTQSVSNRNDDTPETELTKEELSPSTIDFEDDSASINTQFDESAQSSATPQPLTITLGQEDLSDEATFLKKLKSILATSSPINTGDLGMGYLYTYPTLPLPHSLSCSECGRLYAIAHPTLELLPLPIYLSDTEYEMIKGIYVDTLL